MVTIVETEEQFNTAIAGVRFDRRFFYGVIYSRAVKIGTLDWN